MPLENEPKQRCLSCGSTDVNIKFYYIWDDESEKWEQDGSAETICRDCGSEGDFQDADVPWASDEEADEDLSSDVN